MVFEDKMAILDFFYILDRNCVPWYLNYQFLLDFFYCLFHDAKIFFLTLHFIGKFNGWWVNSILNFMRKTISHKSQSDEWDIVFSSEINVEFTSQKFFLNPKSYSKLYFLHGLFVLWIQKHTGSLNPTLTSSPW